MRIRTFLAFVRGGQFGLLFRVGRLLEPFYRVCFLASAASHGVLRALSAGPLPLEALAEHLAPETAARRDALEAWLQFGVRLRELSLGPGGYRLRGYVSRKLAEAKNDALAALLQEVVTLHHTILFQTPALMGQGKPFTLADQDARLVARSSRILEPLIYEAVDEVIPKRGPVRLLEVGCGSGTYIRHAAERNRDLLAVGVELQSEAAAYARENLRLWGIEGRAAIETGDIRERAPEAAFDVVTLHNNIYYFPLESRVQVLKHLRGFLVPGGRLLLTTGCRGGSVGMEVLNLWGAVTEGCGRLPEPREMDLQMREAGFCSVSGRSLLTGDRFYRFVGSNPGPAAAAAGGKA
ncbi:MAG: class I SAM-dependent methyltransferase [bacterium]